MNTDCVKALLSAACMVLGFKSQSPGLFFLGVALSLVAMLKVHATDTRPAVILGTAVLIRILALAVEPSDDLWRYFAEPRAWYAGVDIYSVSPSEHSPQEVSKGLNHPDHAAVYPPVIQSLLAPLSLVSHEAYDLRLWMAGFEALLLGCMFWMKWPGFVLWAFNPVVWFSIWGRGHFEVWVALALLLAILAWSRRQKRLCGYILSLAAGMKGSLFFGLAAFCHIKSRPVFCSLLLGLAIQALGLLWAPQWLWNVSEFLADFSFMALPGRGWLLGPAAIFLILLVLGSQNPWQCLLRGTALCILLLPTIHFWYWLPVLLLAAYLQNRALAVFPSIWLVSVPAWFEQQAGNGFLLQPEFQFLFCGLIVAFVVFHWQVGASAPNAADLSDVGVVIPVQGAEPGLQRLRNELEGQGVGEIISVKANDMTAGRGNQIQKGIEATHCNVILILHADVTLGSRGLSALGSVIRDPSVQWGVLGHTYDDCSPFFRVTELINRLRLQWMGIAFGDQGMWFRKSALIAEGQSYAIPLMEDVELSLVLQNSGWPVYLNSPICASARRWQTQRQQRMRIILRLLFSWLLCRRAGIRLDPAELFMLYYNPVGKSKNS